MSKENNLDNFDPNNHRDDDRDKNDFFRRGGYQYSGNSRGNYGGGRRYDDRDRRGGDIPRFHNGGEIEIIEIEIIEIIIHHLEVGDQIEDFIGMITEGDIILIEDMIIIIIQIPIMKIEIIKEKISIEKMMKKEKFKWKKKSY